MQLYPFLLVFCSTIVIFCDATGVTPTRPYRYREDLAQDRDKFVLFWEPSDDKIIFEVHARTQGWVALGISREGGMFDTDVAMGWIKDDGTAVLQDRYSKYTELPSVDAHQDLTLISGLKSGDYVILTFSRPLSACDEEDVAIEHMNSRLVWALGIDIPRGDEDPVKHRDHDRGSKTVLLLSSPDSEHHLLPNDATAINLMSTNVRLKTDLDAMYNVYIRLPTFNTKKHLIMWEPVIEPGNEKVTHHFLGGLCHKKIKNSTVPDRWEGWSSDNPGYFTCPYLTFAWSFGGKKVWLPDDVGIPVGGPDSPYEYLWTQIMYHNVERAADLRDSSGLRLWLTEELRPNEASLMMLGSYFSTTNLIVPPQSDAFTIDGHCPRDCIKKGLQGESKITVPMVMLHNHYYAKNITVRHVRNGRELPPVTVEKYHEMEFQEFRKLPSPVVIQDTDNLIVECTFDTTKRARLTTGADSVEHELCLAIFLYYPAVPLSLCNSVPTDNQLMKFLDLKVINGRVVTAGKYHGMTTTQVLFSQAWHDPALRQRFEDYTRQGRMNVFCSLGWFGNAEVSEYTGRLPSQPYTSPSKPGCKTNGASRHLAGLTLTAIIMAALTAVTL